MNPEHKREIKYPREVARNREPASAWLIARSDSTLGISGARTIRAKKFIKKMEVSSKSGVIRPLKVS